MAQNSFYKIESFFSLNSFTRSCKKYFCSNQVFPYYQTFAANILAFIFACNKFNFSAMNKRWKNAGIIQEKAKAWPSSLSFREFQKKIKCIFCSPLWLALLKSVSGFESCLNKKRLEQRGRLLHWGHGTSFQLGRS